ELAEEPRLRHGRARSGYAGGHARARLSGVPGNNLRAHWPHRGIRAAVAHARASWRGSADLLADRQPRGAALAPCQRTHTSTARFLDRAVARRVVPVHRQLYGRAAYRSLRDIFYCRRALAAVRAGGARAEHGLAAQPTALDSRQRLLVSGGLRGVTSGRVHLVSPGNAAAAARGVAGAGCDSDDAARARALGEDYRADGPGMRHPAHAVGHSQRRDTARISA